MSVTFNQCPSCQTMVLPDTPVCPNCKHVFQAESEHNQLPDRSALSVQDKDTEDECSGCGEMVRSGLVRCWNCGNFMKSEIAEAYRDMKSRPSEVIYSPFQEDSEGHEFGKNRLRDEELLIDEFEIDDEGFELADEVSEAISTTSSSQEFTLPKEEQAEEDSEETPPAELEEDEAPHSEATGGEVLFKMAREEEKETSLRRIKNLPPGIFIVFCPNGHRIKVHEKHRGKQGKCPACNDFVLVPFKAKSAKKADNEETDEATNNEEDNKIDKGLVTGAYSNWMEDVHQHKVDLGRLKLRPNSLAKDFSEVDIAFSEEGILLNVLVKPGSLFGSANKKKPTIREDVHEALTADRPLDKLPSHAHHFFAKENLHELKIVQPTISELESLFHDIPVFGEGHIAIRLPKATDSTDLEFLSFNLSDFRKFVTAINTICGVDDFYEGDEIPLTNGYETFKCHYTDTFVAALNNMEYFKADESFELVTTGYQCTNCGLAMSEEGREAEKFGGPKGKSIAKSKCPGCEQKFGDLVLEALIDDPTLEEVLKEAESSAENNEEEAASETATDDANPTEET